MPSQNSLVGIPSAALRSPKWFLVTAALACVMLIMLLVALEPWSNSSNFDEPLSVENAPVSFGTQWASEAVDLSLVVHNPSSRDILVRRIHTSCGCNSISPASFAIPHGTRRRIDVQLNLLPARDDVARVPLRDFTVTLIPEIEGISHTRARWQTSGTIKTPFHFTPSMVSFSSGEEIVRGLKPETKTAKVNPNGAFRIADLGLAYDSSLLRAEWKPATNGGGYDILINPNPDMPTGNFDSVIQVSGVLSTGERLPPIPLPVVGTVVPIVSATPSSIHAGQIQLNEVAACEVILRTRNGVGFRIRGFTAPQSLSIAPFSGEFAAAHVLRVDVQVDRPGYFSEVMRIVTAAEDGSTAQLDIPVDAYCR